MQIYCTINFINILGHKILHRVFREKFLELAVQLSSEGLIVRYYQSGLLELLYDVFHSKGLAGACNPQ